MDDAGLSDPALVQSDGGVDSEMPALPAHSDVISCFLSLFVQPVSLLNLTLYCTSVRVPPQAHK